MGQMSAITAIYCQKGAGADDGSRKAGLDVSTEPGCVIEGHGSTLALKAGTSGWWGSLA